jgi:hypothetical protein
MSTSSGQTFADLFAELLASYVTPTATTLARWATLAWRCYLCYVFSVFILAASGFQSAALTVWALTPIVALLVVIFVIPGMALGTLLWPAIRETRLGAVVDRLRERFVKGVIGGGWFAYSLGNDVNDISRFRWSHPWLSLLLCVFAIPAVLRELKGDEEWGFWGVGACIVSAIVYALDFLRLFKVG